MPSVGMRRTTRVFGARILRSGRRLWTGPAPGKRMRAADGDHWIELLDNSGDSNDGSQCRENRWHDDVGLKQEVTQGVIDEKTVQPVSVISLGGGLVDQNGLDRMWGSVYQRKRKRVDSKMSVSSGRVLEERRYGKHFCRKLWRKRVGECALAETFDSKMCSVGQDVSQVYTRSQVIAAVVGSSCRGSSWLVYFLNSVLRYMRRARVRLLQLSAFVLSEPIAHVYSSHGIQFLRDSTFIKSSGVCKIFGARYFIPLFAVDFSALPFCFMFLHSSLYLRSAYLHYLLASLPDDMDVDDDKFTDDEERPSCIYSEGYQSGNSYLASVGDTPGKKRLVQAAAAPKFGRILQSRNGFTSHSIQKRRSSLRVRRGRISSAFIMHKINGALVSDLFNCRRDGVPSSSVASILELRSAALQSSTPNIKEQKSTLVGLMQDLDSTSCSANILVIDSDKCYREEGAVITLEISAFNQWFLAIKRDGIRRYSLKAQKVMRPCSCNRLTHAIIWSGDSGWKLEFPNRRDWLIFKELYKECSDRSVQVPAVSVIPVPGVCEVSGYSDSNSIPFTRPPSYISLKADEVARALVKRTANYDVDSEDEEWLNKFNKDSFPDVSAESFELMIDALEKGFYCNPDDYSDEKVGVNLCWDFERREVLEAVYSYWMRKRKQKRSTLLRVFQRNQHSRPQLIPKPVMRKKRSFKRQASQAGRGKQRAFLQAMAAEQNALEQQNAICKVDEAEAAATRSEGMAVLKRQRAQLLVENADLATYRAAMALRIAEAARAAKSSDTLASLFFLN